MNLNPVKTTFRLNGSSNNKIEDLLKYTNETHGKTITRTEIINISVNEFLNEIKSPEDINQYLIKYNLL